VILVKNKTFSRDEVIKIMLSIDSDDSNETKQEFLTEYRVLRRMQGPHVVELLGLILSESQGYTLGKDKDV